MDKYAKEKMTEQNLVVRSGKSEAKVTNNKIGLDVLYYWSWRHVASRGLSATTELFVFCAPMLYTANIWSLIVKLMRLYWCTSIAQLTEIRKFSYAKVLCENADHLPYIQPQVLFHPLSVMHTIVK